MLVYVLLWFIARNYERDVLQLMLFTIYFVYVYVSKKNKLRGNPGKIRGS